MNNTVVLDFFGVPGCGKSTISHKVAENLRNRGYSVVEPSYYLDHECGTLKRKFVKLWRYIVYSLFNFDKSKQVYILVKNNGYTKFSECFAQSVNIVSKYIAVKKSKVDYIIFDEGFCQATVSLMLKNKNISDIEFNFKKIIDIYGLPLNLKPVYLQLDIETALRNLKKRGTDDSRVDKEQDEVKQRALINDFQKLCEQLRVFTNAKTCLIYPDTTIGAVVKEFEVFN